MRSRSRRPPKRSSRDARTREDCDVRILLANATIEEARELAKQFPGSIWWSAPAGTPPLRARENRRHEGAADRGGPQGMYVIVVGFFDDAKQPVRFQRVALDSRFKDTAEMKQLMASYQDQLEATGLGRAWAIKQRAASAPEKGDKLPANSPRRPVAKNVIRRLGISGARPSTRTPPKRSPSSIHRGSTTPSASVATPPAGIQANSFPM